MNLALDHLAVVAGNLDEGCEYVKECLGIDVPFGGEHSRMGTHNCLAKLGNDEFIEVIAINPKAPKPQRPRWFNLDHHGHRPPFLAHWIARTDNINSTLANIDAPVGKPLECVRGNLIWQLSVPDDGSFAFDGAFPSVIEWPMRPYPGQSMHDVGCVLQNLTIIHPNHIELQQALQPHLNDERIQIIHGASVKLNATVHTPTGVRSLG